MDTTYDIFKRLNDAEPPLWIETLASLEQAKQRLAGLSSKQPGKYMVLTFVWEGSLNRAARQQRRAILSDPKAL